MAGTLAGTRTALAAALMALAAGPGLADVKAGVNAWSEGDYARAVVEWQGPAAEGDAKFASVDAVVRQKPHATLREELKGYSSMQVKQVRAVIHRYRLAGGNDGNE